MLLSFERPAPAGPSACSRTRKGARERRLSTDLENCTVANETGITDHLVKIDQDHRQDSKGTRWMPWHLESMKDVNGCDKPR